MKKNFFTSTILLFSISIFGQPKKSPVEAVEKPAMTGTVPRSNLHIKNSGLPLNMAVLRYKDSTLLAIEPSEVSNTFVGYNNRVYDYKNLKSHGFTFFFPKEKLADAEVIELVSTYGFHLTDGMLNIVLSQNGLEWKQQKLPPYLHFSIETISLD